MTGLAAGLILLALRETHIMSAEVAQQLLTFNHTNFFVYAFLLSFHKKPLKSAAF